MTRLHIPLLIGGATTSKVHTAVKIAPHYTGPVIHVADASRAIGVCSNLLSDTLRDDYLATVVAEQTSQREGHANRKDKNRISLEQARGNKLKIDWQNYTPPKPNMRGTKTFFDYPLAEIAQYIDWTPFFQTWELRGRYPAILQDPVVGESARSLWDDAQAMLQKIIDEKWLRANAVIGLFPANTVDDDIEIYKPETGDVLMTWHTPRQQFRKVPGSDGKPNPNLAWLITSRRETVVLRIILGCLLLLRD